MKRVIPIQAFDSWASALCARCAQPGHCCTKFNLSNEAGEPRTAWDSDVPVAGDLPFKPLERWGQWTVESGPDAGRTYSAWFWTCPKVDAAGRCTIYETRPALCQRYEPLQDHLCIMKAPQAETLT
jgi:Fe-S-cluster containining protein